MTTRPYKPTGVPGLMPYLTVQEAEKAIAFYEKAFSFEVKGEPMQQDGRIVHAEMSFLDTIIMLAPEGAFGGKTKTPANSGVSSPLGLYIYCKDVDGFYNRAVESGARAVLPPEDMFWGDRMCKLADPDGYEWAFAQNVGEFDASKIPGS